MEALSAAVTLHSLAMGVGMNIPQAFVPAATSSAAFVGLVLYGKSSKPDRASRITTSAWRLTVVSLVFSVVLGVAVGPRKWLYESVGAFYAFLLVISTFSARHDPGEAVSSCMIGFVLAASASIDGDVALGFRWLAAAASVLTSVSCMYREAFGYAQSRPNRAFGGKFDIELVVARTLVMPLILAVAYSQSTDSHSLTAGEVVAGLIVILAATGADWETQGSK